MDVLPKLSPTVDNPAKCRKRGHRSGWIRREKRAAIYARDRWTCVYCERDSGLVKLTLDHVRPRSNGGHNKTSNLVTACRPCNSSRQAQPLREWCAKKGLDYKAIIKRIRNAIRRKLSWPNH